MKRRVILIEFNELSPELLRRFMSDDMIPNFKRFFNESTIYTTRADDAQLNPWVIWPTIHSGLPAVEHGIAHMGDGGLEMSVPCMAEVASQAGLRVGVFGSMNVNYGRLSGYYIPDPWDKRGRAYPEFLNRFYGSISQQVKESSRYATNPKQLIQLAAFLLFNGLSVNTASSIVRQLVSEKFDPGVRWRRAITLDQLSYDVFRSLNRRYDVEFATFFSNSTAHFQHFYWSDMEPEAFTRAPVSRHPALANAILDGYRAMDKLLHQIMCDYPETTLILCTGLSQGPAATAERLNYRLFDIPKFLTFAGLNTPAYRLTTAMSAEFHIHCTNADDAKAAAHSLKSYTVGDDLALNVAVEGLKIVLSWRSSNDAGRLDRLLKRSDALSIRFGDVVHMLEGSASGVHRREGSLWLRNGSHSIVEDEVAVTDIAPTILELLGVPQPAHMRGRSILTMPEKNVVHL